jgi:cell wall-associated NlpC family hydrolase
MCQTQPWAEARAALVAVARSWIGTRYVLGGRVKGAGCDCASFLGESLIEAGVTTRESVYGGLGVYHLDWCCHTKEQRYMLRLLRHAQKAMEGVAYRSTEIEPGNLLLVRVGSSRLYNHGGIVLAWPLIAHAIMPCVEEVDATRHPMWAHREVAVFDPFALQT